MFRFIQEIYPVVTPEGVQPGCGSGGQHFEAEIDVDPDAWIIPIQDFDAKVERVEKLTGDIIGIWLKLDKDLDFQAGQYINLQVPGVAQPRAFSIASSVSQLDLIELHVRYVPDCARRRASSRPCRGLR